MCDFVRCFVHYLYIIVRCFVTYLYILKIQITVLQVEIVFFCKYKTKYNKMM